MTSSRCAGPSRADERRAHLGDAAAVTALPGRHGVAAGSLDIRPLLAHDPARRVVLAALAPVDDAETPVGLGAIDLRADADVDTLVVDERAAGLARLLREVVRERAQTHTRRVAEVASAPMPSTEDAARRAAGPQPLWAIVPPEARARYLRRTAQAVLDELDDLVGMLAAEAGLPRTEALLAELLPSVAGLHELADDGPEAVADRRLGAGPVRRLRRGATLIQAPAGVVGIRGGTGSPWAEPVLETAAAVLAGNGVVLSTAVGPVASRLASAMTRAGLPDGLLQVVPGPVEDAELAAACDRTVSTGLTGPKGAMLVLDGAPLDATVSAALWAAFSRAGHGPASVGRIVCVPSVAARLLARLAAGAGRLRVGDPADPETEVGPLSSAAAAARVEALVREAEAAGAVRLCGGPIEGPRFAPVVVRSVPPDARLLREPVPGPVLAVVEAGSEADAMRLARPRSRPVALPAGAAPEGAAPTAGGWAGEAAPAISVWAGDRAHGERVARALGAELTWVNEHGVAAPAAPVRIARHTAPRQLASQPLRLRSARWLPYDPALARASETAARLLHGRESERVAALRRGGPALARVAARLGRETFGR